MDEARDQRRPIRSYVLRAGRLTEAQQRALDSLYPRFGVPQNAAPVDWQALFGRNGRRVIEIGFGNGESTWRMAMAEADTDFIALEVHPPGVGRLLQSIEEQGIRNLRLAMTDAVPFLRERIAGDSLQGVRIYFPDPWPKKRHHKRRIIQPDFVALLAGRLAPGGLLHLATDWQAYADHMLEVLGAESRLRNRSITGGFSARPDWRPETKYERRGQGLGHETRDLLFERV